MKLENVFELEPFLERDRNGFLEIKNKHIDKKIEKVHFYKIFFVNCTFDNCVFSECNFSQVTFTSCTLKGITFNSCSLDIIRFFGTSVGTSRFKKINVFNDIYLDPKTIFFSVMFADIKASKLQIDHSVLTNITWYNCNFTNSDFSYSVMRSVDFHASTFEIDIRFEYTILRGVKFHYCVFKPNQVCFNDAVIVSSLLPPNFSLNDITLNYHTVGLDPAPIGELIGWKKASDHIIKLKIPMKAKRSRATTNKYRCEYAKVLSIFNLKQNVEVYELEHKSFYSDSSSVIYKVGKFVYPDKWDNNRWDECSNGIHFFLHEYQALSWS